jgi:hypothetical protein
MNKLLISLTLIAAFFTSNAIAEKINYYGHEYSGDLKDGKPHGEGEIIHNDGSTFVGSWEEGKMVYGTLTFSNGVKYIGEFMDGYRNGQGTMTWPNGDSYVGEWHENNRHGKGTYIRKGYWKYEGNFDYGVKDGHGALTLEFGDSYVGEFSIDDMTGEGTYYWANGDSYVGEVIKGVPNGKGTMTWANGDSYVGEWKNNKFHGMGVLNDRFGQYEGLFENGSKDLDYQDKKIKADKEKALAKTKRDKEMKLQLETKCANKAGKASNDFAAKKIYESCMAANK